MEDKKQLSGLPKLKSEKVKIGRRTVTQKRFTDRGQRRSPQPPEVLGVWSRSPQKLSNFLKNKLIQIQMQLDHNSDVFRAI